MTADAKEDMTDEQTVGGAPRVEMREKLQRQYTSLGMGEPVVIAHETPLDQLLPDRDIQRAVNEDVCATYLSGDIPGG